MSQFRKWMFGDQPLSRALRFRLWFMVAALLMSILVCVAGRIQIGSDIILRDGKYVLNQRNPQGTDMIAGVLGFIAIMAFFYAMGVEPNSYWSVTCPFCGERFRTSATRDPEINPIIRCPKCEHEIPWGKPFG